MWLAAEIVNPRVSIEWLLAVDARTQLRVERVHSSRLAFFFACRSRRRTHCPALPASVQRWKESETVAEVLPQLKRHVEIIRLGSILRFGWCTISNGCVAITTKW